MFSVFQSRQYQNILDIDSKLDARVSPGRILDELIKLSEQKSCLKLLTKKTKNGFKIMRRLSFAHLLLMYSSKFYGLIEKFIDANLLSSDQWLNQQAIKPYYFFLKKILSSTEIYSKTKEPFQTFNFEKSFYIYNILVQMFKIVAKMPLLGRYYKQSNQQVTSSFVETIAVQAQKFYLPWKTGLQELFNNHNKYIQSRGQQQLVKVLLEQCLPFLNEQMKKLFLDKYFYPYGKGIGIRLFRTQQQSEQTCKIINGIVKDHKQTERRQAQQQLQNTLFPENGQFNYKFFEQTLLPNQLVKQQQVWCSDDEEGGQRVGPVNFQQTTIKVGKDQKQTSDHMEYCEDV